MVQYVGGLRDRLIVESVRSLIEDCMDQLGWFDVDNALINRSLTVMADDLDKDTELHPNIICVTIEDTDYDYAELGSNLSEFRYGCAIDIYAEDAASGKHMCGDVRAILEGRFTSIGRNDTIIPIYDMTLATPTVIFNVDSERISSGRQRFYNKPFEKYWWTIVFDLVDTYSNEDD